MKKIEIGKKVRNFTLESTNKDQLKPYAHPLKATKNP